jgi:hypothetical protein
MDTRQAQRRIVSPEEAEADSLTPRTHQQDAEISSVGSVDLEDSPYEPRQREYRTIRLTMDNSGGSTVADYMIGDPYGIVDSVHNLGGPKTPDDASIDPDILMEILKTSPILFAGINYKVKQGATQFDQEMNYYFADLDNVKDSAEITWGDAVRNNQFQQKVLTKKFKSPLPRLDHKHGLFLSVEAGETVNLNLFIKAVRG